MGDFKNLIERNEWRSTKELLLSFFIILLTMIFSLHRIMRPSENWAINYAVIIISLGAMAGFGEIILTKGKSWELLISSMIIAFIIGIIDVGAIAVLITVFMAIPIMIILYGIQSLLS